MGLGGKGPHVGHGLYRFNPVTQEGTLFTHDSENEFSLMDNQVFSLHIDGSNNLWAGTAKGLCRYDAGKCGLLKTSQRRWCLY